MAVVPTSEPLISEPVLATDFGNAGTGRHFRALLRKNLLLKRRQWSATWCPFCPFAACCELVLPVAVVMLLWWAKSECVSSGQCSVPITAGWGSAMPMDDMSTECVAGLPLYDDSGRAVGFSTCASWNWRLKRPLPFHRILAYLYWSGRRLILAADDPENVPKLEKMRDFISEQWYPEMWMMNIPCENLERPALTIQDLKHGKIGPHGGSIFGNRTLPCESYIPLPHPGLLPSFKDLTSIYTKKDLDAYLNSYDYGDDGLFYGAIVFSSIGGDGSLGAPGKWSYRIQLNATCENTPITQGPPTHPLDLGLQLKSAYEYLDKGFVSLQLLMDRYIIGQRTSDANVSSLLAANNIHLTPVDVNSTREQLAEPLRYLPHSLEAVPMPVAGVVIDRFYELIAKAFPIMFIVAFLYTQKSIINELITEKETKVRESLRMLGISSIAIFGSWYVTYAAIFAGICSVFAVIAGLVIFPSSSATLIFTFFWLWSMSFLSFALFVHAFFNQARTGGIIGVILMFCQWVIFASQNRNNQPATPLVMHLLMIMPNGAFCAGLNILSKFEGSKVGAYWSNLALPVNNSSLGLVLLMLCVDIVLWTFVGWYLDMVLPKEFGVRHPPYFLFLPSYWTNRSSRQLAPSMGEVAGDITRCCHAENVEEVPGAIAARSEASGTHVKICGLRREFSTPAGVKIAVEGLDLAMYEGQILALLGHNGAGKSTTINMLTGMVAPSTGDAFVIGHSIRSQMREIRRLIGVCPQHDVLWLDLTVMEHLRIFALLRGVHLKDVGARAIEMMENVGLTEKALTRAGSLSGGQKRKLSLCLALIGQSRVVFLDEPTSGMDPFSRRSTWNIIRDSRDGRVIVLTTHFMDEADILGDRIAILSEGKLQCCGSSLFLKNRFGAGYRIACTRRQHMLSGNVPAEAQHVDEHETIATVIRKHVPEAQLLTDVGAELTMRLPVSASPRFPSLFEELDTKLAPLGIDHYGLSMVTLEEVFLRIASGELEEVEGPLASKESTLDRHGSGAPSQHAEAGIERERVTTASHMVAMLSKRARYGRRDFKSMICMILIPVLWLAFGLWILHHFSNTEFPAQSLNMEDQYGSFRSVPVNETCGAEWSAADFVSSSGPGGGHVHTILESIPLRLDHGLVFGVNYSHGMPIVTLCEENATLFGKCWRDEHLCPFIWQQLRSLTLVGFDFSCSTDRESCKNTITSNCENDARGCTEKCQDDVNKQSTAKISKELCHETCEEICDKITHAEWICDLLLNETVAWICPIECANLSNPDTCPPRTACRQAMSHPADPPGTLAFSRELYAQGLGTPRDQVRYGAVKPTKTEEDIVAVTLLYNTSGVHVVPTLFNLVSSSLKKHFSGSDSAIEVQNQPFPLTVRGDVDRLVDAVVNLFSSFVIIQAFSFIPAAVVAYIVREREAHHNSKHQQLLSGVGLFAFWMSNFLWDLSVYMVPLILSMLFMWIFRIEAFIMAGAWQATLIIFLGYGLAVTALTYLVSFMFAKHTTAQVICLVANFVTGLLLVQVSYVLAMIDSTKATNDALMYIFRLFPGFALGHGLLQVCTNSVFVSILGADAGVNYFDWDIAGLDILYLYVAAPVFFGLTLWFDSVQHSPWAAAKRHLDPHMETNVEEEDEDVRAEALRVANGGADSDVIRLVDLKKVYRTPEGQPKAAVRGLSFGLPCGECFGFLGINGAGKTSTLNILTGAILPSGGSAFLRGFDVVKEQRQVRQLLGYCPQHDALLDRLTVREHLQLYGRIKGIPQASLAKYCKTMMQDLSLTPHMDKLSMTLSGGNKRKLSLAIAMMGSPPLIFLDEPSTGVDPAARRLMWNVISDVTVIRKECSVMLTTHNMEEAEALCTRIGIMVGGRLRCIGSNQHLKSRFSSGYQLEVRLSCPDSTRCSALAEQWGLLSDITPSDLADACSKLGAAERAQWVQPGCEQGHMLFEAFKAGPVPPCTFVEWWTMEDRAETLNTLLEMSFPGTVALERHDRTLRFRLPASCPGGLAGIFRKLEETRTNYGVEDYGISQTSLEQIFNEFASQQQEETGPVQGLFVNGRTVARSPQVVQDAPVESGISLPHMVEP